MLAMDKMTCLHQRKLIWKRKRPGMSKSGLEVLPPDLSFINPCLSQCDSNSLHFGPCSPLYLRNNLTVCIFLLYFCVYLSLSLVLCSSFCLISLTGHKKAMGYMLLPIFTESHSYLQFKGQTN